MPAYATNSVTPLEPDNLALLRAPRAIAFAVLAQRNFLPRCRDFLLTVFGLTAAFLVSCGSADSAAANPAAGVTVKTPGQPQQAWVARYDGPGHVDDSATAIAVDSAGNVFVTGWSCNAEDPEFGCDGVEYATVKYDNDGNQLWVARYAGPVGVSVPSAMALDAAGNIYVTGYSLGIGTSRDYATVKYDNDGNQLWVARYNGAAAWTPRVAVDVSGNVYVTGASSGGPTYSDYATVKYDTDGNQLWVARYVGPGSGDYPSAIALDAGGNVYVTGQSYGATRSEYATLKYDADGNQLWVARYHGMYDYDAPAAMALDAIGNVYVTGRDDQYFATVKYDNDGNQLWVTRYGSPGSSFANAIALDVSGNVYVTGESSGVHTYADYATVKYDNDGKQLWVALHVSPGVGSGTALAMALDTSGNVYVTGGNVGIGTAYDYDTVKYDSDGNQLWDVRYNGPGNANDFAYAIAVDAVGNVYVTGVSGGGAGTLNDYATVKYSQE